MINDAALMTLGRGSRSSSVTFGSCQVRGERGHEFEYETVEVNLRTIVNTTPVLVPIA